MFRHPLKFAILCFGASFGLVLVAGGARSFSARGLSVTNGLRLAGWLAVVFWGIGDSRQLLQGTWRSRWQAVLAGVGYAGLALIAAYLAGAIPDQLRGA